MSSLNVILYTEPCATVGGVGSSKSEKAKRRSGSMSRFCFPRSKQEF